MKELFYQIKEHVEPAETIVIEAAHIYADKEPRMEQQGSAILASEVLANLQKPTHKTLLIDDVPGHITFKTLDVGLYVAWLAQQGYPVDEVVMESTLKPDAHQLLGKLKEVIPAKKLKNGKSENGGLSESLGFYTAEYPDKVRLLESSGRPTCSLLDASFYLKKAQTSGTCITILPEEYYPQQLETFAILRKVKPDLNIVNIFFNPNNFWDNVKIVFNRV